MFLETGCRSNAPHPDPEPGVPLLIAAERATNISGVRYDLSLSIPSNMQLPLAGKMRVRFSLKDRSQPLVLDFAPGEQALETVAVNGNPSSFRAVNGHIVIPASELVTGDNTVDIQFHAGDASLNRNPDFLYALFVPARAHLAIPCFDQPDLKGRFTLQLEVPGDWQAVSNGAETSRENAGERVRMTFAETEPISTYLFTFAAGKFQVDTASRNGRTFRMFHRENDAKKVERNRDAIFDLHASALAWLEDYTAIPYRFGKFDFVLVPSFQFGGMEHPGSIFYNATSLMLDESATENQMLGRASVIAHETAHMWFGDLVTMRWFNDVWMKEVFANFMAAKIVNPAFPKVNHELRFLLAHYPSAYGVDRTAGTHPIRQELANLNEAGSLYGAIIYQKAPIVMRQLEKIVGPDRFREGLRVYLKEFEFGNATWLDLVQVLDERTEADLADWSRAWVEEAGRPRVETVIEPQGSNLVSVGFAQSDADANRGLRWTQQLDVLIVERHGRLRSVPVKLERDRAMLPEALEPPLAILPTGGGLGYGAFVLDEASRKYLIENTPSLADPVARGAAWVTLWEEMLDGRVPSRAYFDLALKSLPREDTEQNVQLLLGHVDELFWRFLSDQDRQERSIPLEKALRDGMTQAKSQSLKSAYFSAFREIVTSPAGTEFLARVWARKEAIPGLTLAETDEASMALDLAVRAAPAWAQILDEQKKRFQNEDRRARFEFVVPALSDDIETRGRFFRSLADVQNRRREPWVLEGLRYLNHPLRASSAEPFLLPSLEMLEEIRRTGDIFFPRNWMDSVLDGHRSRAAANTVRQFLDGRPQYPVRLRRIVLQAADKLYRASEAVSDRK